MLPELAIPLIITGTAMFAAVKKTDLYQAAGEGATEGLKTVAGLFPTLVMLFSAIGMLRASGALDALTKLVSPAFSRIGIPPELAPLVMIRPISGSGAFAVGTDIIMRYGADSLIGRTAAVMLGSTETTFYVITVYFGSQKIKRTRYTIPAALCADLAGFLAAAFAVRVLS